MGIQKFEVQPVGIDYICEVCNNGYMQSGDFLTVNPPTWKHACSSCGAEMILHEKYPTISFERVIPKI